MAQVTNGGGLFEEAYSHEALETILQRYFGDKRLSDCGTPVMVTSYDIEHRKTVFIKSWHSDHSELLCAEASRATSAAPTYFEPVNLEWAEQSRTLIDGGVFINSPAVSAYAEARKLFPDEPIAMLSLGTGELTRSIPYDEARTWGSALWVMSLLDCMFDGASKAADHQMRLFLGDHYLRLQTQLHYASDDMDAFLQLAQDHKVEQIQYILDILDKDAVNSVKGHSRSTWEMALQYRKSSELGSQQNDVRHAVANLSAAAEEQTSSKV